VSTSIDWQYQCTLLWSAIDAHTTTSEVGGVRGRDADSGGRLIAHASRRCLLGSISLALAGHSAQQGSSEVKHQKTKREQTESPTTACQDPPATLQRDASKLATIIGAQDAPGILDESVFGSACRKKPVLARKSTQTSTPTSHDAPTLSNPLSKCCPAFVRTFHSEMQGEFSC
jgi:hypothetical protein